MCGTASSGEAQMSRTSSPLLVNCCGHSFFMAVHFGSLPIWKPGAQLIGSESRSQPSRE